MMIWTEGGLVELRQQHRGKLFYSSRLIAQYFIDFFLLFSSPALSRPPSALATANIENADARHDALIPQTGTQHDNAGNAVNVDENADDDGNFNEQTTLLNNEEESFALAPIDASALKGMC